MGACNDNLGSYLRGGQGGLMSVWLGLQIGKPVQTNRSPLVSPSLHRVACTKSAPALKLHHLAAINNWTPWQFDPESSSAMHWRGRENVHEASGINFFSLFLRQKHLFVIVCIFRRLPVLTGIGFNHLRSDHLSFLRAFQVPLSLAILVATVVVVHLYIWLNQP